MKLNWLNHISIIYFLNWGNYIIKWKTMSFINKVLTMKNWTEQGLRNFKEKRSQELECRNPCKLSTILKVPVWFYGLHRDKEQNCQRMFLDELLNVLLIDKRCLMFLITWFIYFFYHRSQCQKEMQQFVMMRFPPNSSFPMY